jgi:hypothetical protein
LITATFARHRSILNRHVKPDPTRDCFDEGTLTLEGAADVLSRITEVSYGPRRIGIDQRAKRAIHDYHSDPAIIVDRNGSAFLQLFLYEVDQGFTNPVTISVAGGQDITIPVDHLGAEVAGLRTSVVDADGLKLKVIAQSPFEVIWQTSHFGVEQERHLGIFDAAPVDQPRLFDIPTLFGDRLGVCVSSTNDIYGGEEHKHTFFGEVGLASGRHLLAGDLLLPPRTIYANSRIKSLLVDFLTTDKLHQETLAQFDEVTVVTDHQRASGLASSGFLARKSIRIVTAGRAGDLNQPTDIVMMKPEETVEIGDATSSFLLFADQHSPDFNDRLFRVLARMKQEPGLQSIEQSWTRASKFYEPTWDHRDYGIAFSTSSAELQRGRSTMERSKLTRREEIGQATFNMAAVPFAKNILSASRSNPRS